MRFCLRANYVQVEFEGEVADLERVMARLGGLVGGVQQDGRALIEIDERAGVDDQPARDDQGVLRHSSAERPGSPAANDPDNTAANFEASRVPMECAGDATESYPPKPAGGEAYIAGEPSTLLVGEAGGVREGAPPVSSSGGRVGDLTLEELEERWAAGGKVMGNQLSAESLAALVSQREAGATLYELAQRTWVDRRGVRRRFARNTVVAALKRLGVVVPADRARRRRAEAKILESLDAVSEPILDAGSPEPAGSDEAGGAVAAPDGGDVPVPAPRPLYESAREEAKRRKFSIENIFLAVGELQQKGADVPLPPGTGCLVAVWAGHSLESVGEFLGEPAEGVMGAARRAKEKIGGSLSAVLCQVTARVRILEVDQRAEVG